MAGDSTTKLPPAIGGVVLLGIALVFVILVGSLFAYFGWKSLDADLAPITVMMAVRVS